jgi:hypothetical protein
LGKTPEFSVKYVVPAPVGRIQSCKKRKTEPGCF